MIHDKTVWCHKLPVGPGPSSGPAGRSGVGVGARSWPGRGSAQEQRSCRQELGKVGSVFGRCAGGQRRGQGQGGHKDCALAQVLPPRGRAGPEDPCPRRRSPVRRGCSWGSRRLPQHRMGPSVLSTLVGGTGPSRQSPVGQRPVSVGHDAPLVPHSPARGCLVTQLSLPGRSFALGSHCLTWQGL